MEDDKINSLLDDLLTYISGGGKVTRAGFLEVLNRYKNGWCENCKAVVIDEGGWHEGEPEADSDGDAVQTQCGPVVSIEDKLSEMAEFQSSQKPVQNLVKTEKNPA